MLKGIEKDKQFMIYDKLVNAEENKNVAKSNEDKHCLNCGEKLSGNFCTECGQPASTGRINFKETLGNFFSVAFALNEPLLITIRLLITNPGKLFREYIDGKRKVYYRPVAFFILTTASYLILRTLINFNSLGGSVIADMEEVDKVLNHSGEVFTMMENNINYVMFFLVFSIAFSLKLFFRKKYNLVEYTSVGLFITGIYTIIRTVTMFISKYTSAEVDSFEIGILLVLVFYSTFLSFKRKALGL